MDQKDPSIDTVLFLRDGAPRSTVCKVQMKDGRIGIGVYRSYGWVGEQPPQEELDANAFAQAVWDLPDMPVPQVEPETDEDLQASLGQKAHT